MIVLGEAVRVWCFAFHEAPNSHHLASTLFLRFSYYAEHIFNVDLYRNLVYNEYKYKDEREQSQRRNYEGFAVARCKRAR